MVASISWAVILTRSPVDLQAALEHIAHAELAADLAHVVPLPLNASSRVAGDDEQLAAAGELGDEVLGESVGEPLLSLIAAKVVKRQDGDRGAVERAGARPRSAAALCHHQPPATASDEQDEQRGDSAAQPDREMAGG